MQWSQFVVNDHVVIIRNKKSVGNYEVSVTPEPERKEKVGAFADLAHERIEVDEGVKKRADYLVSIGFKPFDALHLACAESVVAEVLTNS